MWLWFQKCKFQTQHGDPYRARSSKHYPEVNTGVIIITILGPVNHNHNGYTISSDTPVYDVILIRSGLNTWSPFWIYHFVLIQILHFDWHLKFVPKCPIDNESVFGNGLAPNRRQTIAKSMPIKLYAAICPLIARFMGPTWGPPGSCRPQMGPM